MSEEELDTQISGCITYEHLMPEKSARWQTVGDIKALVRTHDNNKIADLEAKIARVRELHSEFKIYDPCAHKHIEADLDQGIAKYIEEVGLTCDDGYVFSVCWHCCTDSDYGMTLHCSDSHEHGKDSPICHTSTLLSEVGK
jgi:hypothetical protein